MRRALPESSSQETTRKKKKKKQEMPKQEDLRDKTKSLITIAKGTGPVQRPIFHEGYSQPILTTWGRRHKRNQPGNDLQPQCCGKRVLVLLLSEPGYFAVCPSNDTNATPLFCCRSAGAWGKRLLCTKRGTCWDLDRLIVQSPIEPGKRAWDRFELEGRAPKRVKGRLKCGCRYWSQSSERAPRTGFGCLRIETTTA